MLVDNVVRKIGSSKEGTIIVDNKDRTVVVKWGGKEQETLPVQDLIWIRR